MLIDWRSEHLITDREAAKIFTQVSVTKREAEITLDNEDFDERAKNYRRKDWLLKGLNPDMMEARFLRKIKQRRLQTKKDKIKKMQEMKQRVLDSDESAKISKPAANSDCKESNLTSDFKSNMKSINKTIMKKDSRFTDMPKKLSKIGKKTAASKIHPTVTKKDGKVDLMKGPDTKKKPFKKTGIKFQSPKNLASSGDNIAKKNKFKKKNLSES